MNTATREMGFIVFKTKNKKKKEKKMFIVNLL